MKILVYEPSLLLISIIFLDDLDVSYQLCLGPSQSNFLRIKESITKKKHTARAGKPHPLVPSLPAPHHQSIKPPYDRGTASPVMLLIQATLLNSTPNLPPRPSVKRGRTPRGFAGIGNGWTGKKNHLSVSVTHRSADCPSVQQKQHQKQPPSQVFEPQNMEIIFQALGDRWFASCRW